MGKRLYVIEVIRYPKKKSNGAHLILLPLFPQLHINHLPHTLNNPLRIITPRPPPNLHDSFNELIEILKG
jgi:hypothetical protein